jgi:hypothetical protein
MSPRCHQVAEILKAVSSLLCLQPGEQQSPPPADSSRSDRARQFFDMAAERLPGMPSAVSQRIEAPCAGPYLEVLDQRKTPKSSGSTLVPGDSVGKGSAACVISRRNRIALAATISSHSIAGMSRLFLCRRSCSRVAGAKPGLDQSRGSKPRTGSELSPRVTLFRCLVGWPSSKRRTRLATAPSTAWASSFASA